MKVRLKKLLFTMKIHSGTQELGKRLAHVKV